MKEVFRRHLRDPSDLDPLVADLWALRKTKTLWLMEGEIGSGKTETVKALARLLRLQEVASPSFAIHHRYQLSNQFSIDHLDLYRLESEDDLESTGFWDLFSEDEGLLIVEWSNRLETQYYPRDWKQFHLQYRILSQTEREIIVSSLNE